MTPSSPRVKRTAPDRSGPIRNPMAPRGQARPESGPPRDPISAAGAAVYGVLESGVRSAYAVIDEYMRRGQEAARATSYDFYKRGPMNEDRPNFGAGYGNNPWGGGYNNVPNPLSMIMEQCMMAMRMWTQAASAVMPGGFPQPGMYPSGFNEPAGHSVSVKVSASSPVEVEVALPPGPCFGGLVCDPARAEGFTASQIDAPTVEREHGGVRVTVNVAALQAKGRYRALVRRETDGGIAGELIITVS